jgi:tetratricopeptide (TPR) repeat protein
MAYLALARGYGEKGDWVRSAGYYKSALSYDPSVVPVTEVVSAYEKGARSLEEKGDLGTARSFYEEILRFFPENPSYHYQVGRILRKEGKPLQALKSLSFAFERSPEEFSYGWELLLALRESGDPSSAVDLLLVLEKKFPGKPQYQEVFPSLLKEAISLERKRNGWDRLIVLSNLGIQRVPEEGEWYLALGEGYVGKGDWEEASKALKMGFKAFPDYPGIRTLYSRVEEERGKIALQKKEFSKAKDSFLLAIELDPRPSLYPFLWEARLALKEYREILNETEEFQKRYPGDTRYKPYREKALLSGGNSPSLEVPEKQ